MPEHNGRAANLHRRLGRWGLTGKDAHNKFLSHILSRPIESFTEIKEDEWPKVDSELKNWIKEGV